MKNKGIIVLLVLLVLILSFVSYLFSSNNLIFPAKYENEIVKIEKMSDSDEITDIENDLDATEFGNLDAELSNIDTELN